MSRGIYFAMGVLLCMSAWWQASYLRQYRHWGIISWSSLLSVAVFAALGWLCYSFGTGKLKRSTSAIVAFILGVVVSIIQSSITAQLLSNAGGVPALSAAIHSGTLPVSRLLSMLAEVFGPFVFCSVLAPRLNGRLSG